DRPRRRWSPPVCPAPSACRDGPRRAPGSAPRRPPPRALFPRRAGPAPTASRRGRASPRASAGRRRRAPGAAPRRAPRIPAKSAVALGSLALASPRMQIPILDLGPTLAAKKGAEPRLAAALRRALDEVGFYFI